MPERRKHAGSGGRGPRKRNGADRPGSANTGPVGEARPRSSRGTWALDVHLTAPGHGKGDAFHRLEKQEPFKVLGVLWPTGDGEAVRVDAFVEELRAQLLVPEDALPRLRASLGPVRDRRRPREPALETESAALKPERVQARTGSHPKNRRTAAVSPVPDTAGTGMRSTTSNDGG